MHVPPEKEQTTSRRSRCHERYCVCNTGMSCNNVYTQLHTHLQPAMLTLHTTPSRNTMAPSSVSQGNAPTTLTLFPFHNDPRTRQIQPIRPPKVVQQTIPPLYIRNPRNPALAFTTPTSNQTSIVRNARPTVVSDRPGPAPTRNAPRAPNAGIKSNTTTALSPRVRAPTQTTRHPITTVAKVHAIAPVASITSIDSILRADSKQTNNKPTVPDRIRPEVEAIK